MRTIVGAALLLAGLNGLGAVVMGAVGAHVVGDPSAAEWIVTGSSFQMAHAVLLAALAALAPVVVPVVVPAAHPDSSDAGRSPAPETRTADSATRYLLIAIILLAGLGALVFAGALYALALTGVGRGWAPWGGFAMIAAWLALAALGLRVLLRRR